MIVFDKSQKNLIESQNGFKYRIFQKVVENNDLQINYMYQPFEGSEE